MADTVLPTKPFLLLIRGLPGSGKSYLAAQLQATIGPEYSVVLDPDATDYNSQAYLEHTARLQSEGVDPKFHPYRFLRAQAYEAIEAHKTILWNQAFTNLDSLTKTITNLQQYASEHGTQLPVLLVEVEANPKTLRRRVSERAQAGGHDVPPEEFTRFFNDYHSFAEHYPTVQINGEGDVAQSTSQVLDAIQKLKG